MAFADSYLEKQKGFYPSITDNPSGDLQISIIIPCYNEPEIIKTLESLWQCKRPISSVEIIIVINSNPNTPDYIVQQNKRTHQELTAWINKHNTPELRYFVIYRDNIEEKFAGAGSARKIGMDEAIYRFNKIGIENGIIVSLDADATCHSNYLVELEKTFFKKPQLNGLIIYFEHPSSGSEFNQSVYEAITKYELYLRYYKKSLEYCGFPYPFYTIGSCFAVTAKAYIKQGGMNRKQAGEDFYFLQKMFSLGNIEELNTTCVYPSPRPSDRVIFGTGPVIKSMIENPDKNYLTYNFEAFENLKSFFRIIDQLYRINDSDLNEIIYQIPLPLADFLLKNDFFSSVKEINKNSSNIRTFKKRFFEWFNAFKLIKYLNHVHEKFYQQQELMGECEKLLEKSKIHAHLDQKNYSDYLKLFRNLERSF